MKISDDQNFKNKDAESYDSVVAEFDRHTQAYSTYIIETLLQQVGTGPQADFIDIGCGTGVVTFAFAERFGASSKITGIDLSQGMLEFASRAAKARGLDSCTSFLKCDAEDLNLADASVDVAVSLYAFRHFPNPDKAAREVFRVLRPGGRLIMAVGSGPALFSRGGVAAALAMLPRRLAKISGKELTACDFLDGLVEIHCAQSKERETADWTEHHREFSGSLAELAKNAGFEVHANEWRGKEFVVGSVDAFWELQMTFSSMARKRVAEATADELANLERDFRQQCEAVQHRGGRLIYRVGAAVVCAVKPLG